MVPQAKPHHCQGVFHGSIQPPVRGPGGEMGAEVRVLVRKVQTAERAGRGPRGRSS